MAQHSLAAPSDDGSFDMLEQQLKGARRFGTRFAVVITGLVWFLSGAQITLSLFVTQEPPRFPICAPGAVDCHPHQPLLPTDCVSPYHYLRPQISIVSTYDVPTAACEHKPWRNVTAIHSVLFLGIMVGALVLAPLSDKKGRRPMITLGVLGMFAAAMYSTLAPSIMSYAIARFLVGCGSSASALPSMALLSEVTPMHRRQWIVAVQAFAFCVAASYVSILACVVPSWRILTLLVSLPALLFMVGIPCCSGVYVESPKWLAARGRMEEAFGTWLRIAKVCDIELDDKLDYDAFVKNELQAAHDRHLKSDSDVEEELSLMSVKQMVTPDSVFKALRTFPASVWMWVCMWLWAVTAFVYYGVLLDFGDLITSLRATQDWGDATVLKLFNSTLPDTNLQMLPHGANKRLLLGDAVPLSDLLLRKDPPTAELRPAELPLGRAPEEAIVPHVTTSSILDLVNPGPTRQALAVPHPEDPVEAANRVVPVEEVERAEAVPKGVSETPPLLSAAEDLANHPPVPEPTKDHDSLVASAQPADGSKSFLEPSVPEAALSPMVKVPAGPSVAEPAGVAGPASVAAGPPVDHPASLPGSENAELASGKVNAAADHAPGDVLKVGEADAEPRPDTEEKPAFALAPHLHFLDNEKAAEYLGYLDNVGDYVKNRSKGIFEQAKQLPSEAGKLYNELEMQQMLDDLYSDMSAQFTPDDPMAPFWANMRLEGLLVLISFLLEIPAYAVAICMAAHPLFGRKRTVTSLLLVGGSFIIAAFVVQLVGSAGTFISATILGLTVVGRCCIAAVFVILYLYCAEIFPTSIRGSSLGLLSATARIGCIVAAPVASSLNQAQTGLALLVFGCLSLSAAYLGMSTLPETYGQPLYDTIDTLEDMYTKNGFVEDFFSSWPNRVCGVIGRATCCLGRLGANCLSLPGDRTTSTFEEKGHAWLKSQWRRAGRSSRKHKSSAKHHSRDNTMFAPIGDQGSTEANSRLQTRAFDMEEEAEFVDPRSTVAV